MQYTSRAGDSADEAHVNYECPCGCVAGLIYDRNEGPRHLGACCCGRLLWVGSQAVAVVRSHMHSETEYLIENDSVTLPWGETIPTALAVPVSEMVDVQVAAASTAAPARVRDVVCGMTIDPATAAATSTYRGETYYFCAPVCKTRFDADPARYAGQ